MTLSKKVTKSKKGLEVWLKWQMYNTNGINQMVVPILEFNAMEGREGGRGSLRQVLVLSLFLDE
jgi:hypothetical protein